MNITQRIVFRASGVATLGVICTALATASLAQESPDNGQKADASQQLTEVIVTAERHEQSVQKSSLDVTVLSGETLAQISDARDLGSLLPGLEISNGGVTMQTFIRGIGDFGSSALNQSAIAYNIDGVYVANTAEVSTQFFDLQRVEVLKGPQGTLYGRNASAGAINLIYNTPQLGQFSGNVTGEVGNFDTYKLTGALNIPLGEITALRVSGDWHKSDGYLSDGTDDDNMNAARIQLLIQPNSIFSALIVGSVAERRGEGPGSTPILPGIPEFSGVLNPISNAQILANGPTDYTPGAGLPPATIFTQTGLLRDSYLDINQREIHATIDADLGFAKLTFIPSYRWSDSNIGTYVSGGPFLNQEDTNQQSYELRLAGVAGPVDYDVGAYDLIAPQTTDAQIYNSLFIVVNQSAGLGLKSYAPFGQVTFHATNALRLIAGTRYTVEDRSIDTYAVNSTPLLGTAATFDFTNKATFKKLTGRASVEYDLTPDNMLYATASNGFKSGGFNIFEPTATVTNVYQPETLNSYVLGARNRFADNTVQLNVEGFYWDYQNSQQNRLALTPTGALQFSTFNAASATVYGADVDLMVKVTPNDSITGDWSYLHTKFDDFVFPVPFPTDPTTTGCAVNNAGPSFSVNCSGLPLPQAPQWSGKMGYQHAFGLPGGQDITLQGDWQFASKTYQGTDYTPIEQAPSYNRFDASLTYNSANDKLSVTAFVRNITDAVIYRSILTVSEVPFAQVQPPRTFGVRVSTRF